MSLGPIVIAIDYSAASEHALRVMLETARSYGAPLTAVHVTRGARVSAAALAAAGARLDAWTAGVRAKTPSAPPVECAVVAGLPAVELARFAERQGARLLVLGAKERTRLERLYFGDTGDGVVRRSRVPCLFIPRAAALEGGVLVALDGTDRGLPVFAAASEFARNTGQPLRAVTVEPRWPGEPSALAAATPAGRSERLRAMLAASRRADGGASYTGDLAIRRGEPAIEILAERERTRAAVLAVGYRLGGPSAAVETGSVSRRIVHRAPCAVLTVPL